LPWGTDMTIVFVDIETSGLLFWEKDFHLESVSLHWRDDKGVIKNHYARGPQEVRRVFEGLSKKGTPLSAYNIGYEMGVTLCQYPDLNLNWSVDVMRLRQLYNQGSGQMVTNSEGRKELRYTHYEPFSWGLKDAVRTIFPGSGDYEKELHAWMKQSGKSWDRISEFPDELLKPYNQADTEYTLKLYEFFTTHFAGEGFDWLPDHEDYIFLTRQVVQAKIRGIPVDVELLEKNVALLKEQIEAIDAKLRTEYEEEIQEVRQSALDKYKEAHPRGRKTIADFDFNINSKKQLGELATEQLDMEVKLRTAKGSPSFRRAHLSQWENLGDILGKRGTLTVAYQQCKKLAEVSAKDGHWHHDLKTCGTVTGRMAGGGGLNVQGLSRREPLLMKTLIAPPGKVLISCDLSAGEPTVATHYSQDYKYKYFTYDGVGKAPYWQKETLMIDDVYLAFGAVAEPEVMKEAWNKQWPVGTFAQQWLADAEVIKGALKKKRQAWKTIALGLNYGMGPKTLCKNLTEGGLPTTYDEAKRLWNTYWALFRTMQTYASSIAKYVEHKGYMVNEFGYRGTPKPHNAWNFMIQSSVNGVITKWLKNVLEVAPWTEYVVCIHDEIIFTIPESRIEEFKVFCRDAERRLNEDLQWSVNVRTGYVFGVNLFEAK